MTSSMEPSAAQLEALRAVLDEGIARDLYYAMSCDAILRVVGSHATAINAEGAGSFFGLLQRFLVDEMTLAMARIFDRSGGRNNTRSLDEAVRLLRAHRFPLMQPHVAIEALARQGVVGVNDREDDIRDAILGRLQALQAEARPLLDAIVERRDTLLAHHDVRARPRDELPLLRPDMLRLFRLTTNALEITSLPFLSVAHVVNGRFLLQSDSRSGAVELLSLLRRSGVVGPEWTPPPDLWDRG